MPEKFREKYVENFAYVTDSSGDKTGFSWAGERLLKAEFTNMMKENVSFLKKNKSISKDLKRLGIV
jgi:hypothetical protein